MSLRGRILLLWNDTKTVQSIQDQLAIEFEICFTSNATIACQKALHFQPDCILSDFPLDNLMHNHQFKQIRKIAGLESMGILLISDRRENRYASSNEGLGVDLCISRPYLIEEVSAALIGMIQVHKRCQKLLSKV